MNTNPQLSLANRKELADMLADKYESLRSKAKSKFHDKRNVLRESLIKEYAEKNGAIKLIAQIELGREKIHELEDELSTLGFESDHTGLSLSGGSRNPLYNVIDERIVKDIGVVGDIDARFDSAQLAMMTVASLQDAEKLLKSVTEL
jgi:hypothetical protein